MENNDFNFNYAECLQSKNNFGETTYYNICTNETHKVEWGTIEYASGIGIIIFVVTCVLLLFALFILLIKCIFN